MENPTNATFVAKYSKLTSKNPQSVTKVLTLNDDGSIQSSVNASITSGAAEVLETESLSEFAQTLAGLQTNECLIYGIPPLNKVQIVTTDKWYALGRPTDTIPRTKEKFSWADNGGVLMLDYDAPKDGSDAMGKDQLIELVSGVVGDVDLLWYPSTSSCIYNGESQLKGVAGQRIYLMVDDASDIPSLGALINSRLWAKGYGRYEVSKSGALLERPVFDASVWQTNRIDFAAGAECQPPLEQRRGAPYLRGGSKPVFSRLNDVLDITGEESLAIERNKRTAQLALSDKARAVKSAWVEERIAALLDSNDQLTDADARDIATRALDRRELMGDYKIVVVDGQARHVFSVLDILDAPDRFHGCKTLDPIEPDYDGGRDVGKLYLMGGRPRLYSMAHGGQTFNLHRQPARIEKVEGKSRETTDALLDVLRREPSVFDFGQDLVTVNDNSQLFNHSVDSFTYYVAGVTQFWVQTRTSEKLIDPPANVIRQLISLKDLRGLKQLDAVITAPTLRSDGSILDKEGYDPASRLLLVKRNHEDIYPIPYAPTEEQARQALDELWLPFKDFPFASEIDRAVHLSGLLTAAIRPAITAAPGTAYDAPTQGSGKTLLARCVGILTTGEEPSIWPPLSKNEDEIRKRVFTTLLQGARVLLIDNVVESFDSPSLASATTSEWYEERILNKSESRKVPNRAVLLLTGNNLSVVGDMVRRVNICRIDPESETPFDRSFELSPSAYCKANRQRLIAAALTLIRFYLTNAGVSKELASKSFAEWDTFVRKTIIYLSETIADGQFGDVMVKTKDALTDDPGRSAILDVVEGWSGLFGETPMTVGEVLEALDPHSAQVDFKDTERQRLESGLRELSHVGPFTSLNAAIVGKGLAAKKDVVVGGYRLTTVGKRSGATLWRAQRTS